MAMAALAGILAACGGPPAVQAFDPNVTPLSPPLPLKQVFVLESWGAPPDDTVVTFAVAEPRTIIIRRGPPDHGLFARFTFPAGSVVPPRGDSATVRLTIRPGLYGVDLATESRVLDGARVTFSYGIHFVAPSGVRQVYGSNIRFEQFLGVGRLEADSTLVFLDSWRPASDLLMAPIPGPGRFLVAAPRQPPGFRAIIF